MIKRFQQKCLKRLSKNKTQDDVITKHDLILEQLPGRNSKSRSVLGPSKGKSTGTYKYCAGLNTNLQV